MIASALNKAFTNTAALQTDAGAVAFISPFNLDYVDQKTFAKNDPIYRDDDAALMQAAASQKMLSPVSPARRSSQDTGRGGNRDYGLAGMGRAFLGASAVQETRLDYVREALAQQGTTTLGSLSASRRDKLADLENLKQYDSGRIQAEIEEWKTRFPDHAGMDVKKADDNLPMQVIRDQDGQVLMKGRAESVEHLVALKLDEAAKSADPNKKIVNLAGAQLQGCNFDGFNFQNVDMRGAELGGSTFRDCQLKNMDMSGAGLKGAVFDQCHIENVAMNGFTGDSKTTFKNSSLQGVDMSEAHAPQVKFENIRAQAVWMEGAHFAGANISNMHVENLMAKEVNLEGAKIGDLHVTGRYSSLQDAKMNGAQVGGSSFGTVAQPMNMSGLQAQGSTWNNTSFHADLSRADFAHADFSKGIDMRGVTTPTGAMEMAGANLTGLTAGRDAKFRAMGATNDGVEMRPTQDFVFSGTDPIDVATKQAQNAGQTVATILDSDGATQEALNAGLVLQQRQRQMQQKMAMAMAPAPPSPYNKKRH